MTQVAASPRSFRDPDATLVEHDGRLVRAVRPHALDGFRRMLEDPVVRQWMEQGRIVRTRPLAKAERPPQFADFDGECFEHERIPFIGQPAEWAPEMLAAAGCLTLALARQLTELHGGELTAASDGPGRGSTFTLALVTGLNLALGWRLAISASFRRRVVPMPACIITPSADSNATMPEYASPFRN